MAPYAYLWKCPGCEHNYEGRADIAPITACDCMANEPLECVPVYRQPSPVPDVILAIGQKMLADLKENDHHTADPIFIVQKKRRVYGIDTDFEPEIVWLHDGEEVSPDDHVWLEADYESGVVPEDYVRTGCVDEWEHVDSYLTNEAAMARINGGPEGRVSVESAYRNSEMRAVRSFIMDVARRAES